MGRKNEEEETERKYNLRVKREPDQPIHFTCVSFPLYIPHSWTMTAFLLFFFLLSFSLGVQMLGISVEVFDTVAGCPAVADRIVANGTFHAVVGAARSVCSLEMASLLGPAGIPQLSYVSDVKVTPSTVGFSATHPFHTYMAFVFCSYSSTSDALSDKALFPTFFRVPPPDRYQGQGGTTTTITCSSYHHRHHIATTASPSPTP